MSSFNTVIDSLITTLQADAALAAFCTARWKKSLAVKKIFRLRQELNQHDLPIILITRPSLMKSFLIGARDGAHTCRLYCGFHQPDRRKALEELIEFEELIDDALITPEPETLGAKNITPKASANDEGIHHPHYFMVMDLEIQHRR